jgi:hypothetical protein
LTGAKVKSVNSLFRKKPLATSWLPKGPSIVDVIEATLPAPSVATKCVVAGTSEDSPAVRGCAPGGVPASYLGSDDVSEISADRPFR